MSRESAVQKMPRDSQRVCVMLVDNGSLQPAATRQLRRVATALSQRLGRRVEPVSLLHSSAVPARRLRGRSAEILEAAIRRRIAAGGRDFVIVPLFIGRSRALTDYLPGRIARWRRDHPGLRVRVAPPLAARQDDRLARLLEDLVRAKLTPAFLRVGSARVALVDHGSPVRAVTQVRNRIAAQLRRRLGATVAAVRPCSMERRPGAADAFNEPLLATLLDTPQWRSGPVIVAQLFLLPGRHAGPGGDVELICQRARKKSSQLRTRRTALLGRHAGLVGILADRFQAAMR